MNRTISSGTTGLISNADVLFCRVVPEVSTINNRTLGGLWFSQTVGDSAKKASVQVAANGMATRDAILNIYGSGATVIVEFDNYRRTGYILGLPSADLIRRARNVEQRKYTITFEMGINDEVAT
jgi:hypothetical protein